MNNRGQVGLTVVIVIFYFIAGMTLYQFFKPDIVIARTDIGCSAPASWGDMGLCLLLDGIIPYFIIGIISTAGGIITNEAFK